MPGGSPGHQVGGTLRRNPVSLKRLTSEFMNHPRATNPRSRQCSTIRLLQLIAGTAALVFGLGPAMADAATVVSQTADSAKESQLAPDQSGDDELRIREVFSSHLPDTLRENALRMWIHPHLGDFVEEDYLRISTGVRYGVTPRWEVAASTDLYFSHGFGDVGFFEKYGVANIQPSTKLNLGRPLPGWDTAVGADFAFPLGRPPPEITDGLRHYSPWVSFSHRLESRPSVRIFWSLGADFIQKTSLLGTYGRNQFLDHSTHVNAGFVVDRQRMHYTFETTLTTNRGFNSSPQDVLSLRPGFIWEVPPRNDPKGKSHWIVGTGLNVSFGPNGTSLGGSLKLRYNLDLKSLFGFKSLFRIGRSRVNGPGG